MKQSHKFDTEIMLSAIEIAKKSDMRVKHGCIIIDNKGTIISKACNKMLNFDTEKIKNRDQYLKVSYHAEENALKQVNPKKLFGAKLYVVRYGNSDNKFFANSKPCDRCTIIIDKYMKKYGLKNVFYSVEKCEYC